MSPTVSSVAVDPPDGLFHLGDTGGDEARNFDVQALKGNSAGSRRPTPAAFNPANAPRAQPTVAVVDKNLVRSCH